MITHILKHPEKLQRIVSLAFKSMDSNNNGIIDKIELENIMVSMADDLGMEQPSRGEIEDMIKDLDQGNGELFTIKQFRILVHEVLKILVKAEENV